MRLPWDRPVKPDVWRHAYEAAEEHVTALRDEIKRLTDIIVEMRREGFNPGPPPEAYREVTPDLPSGVMQAIHARAAEGTDLYRTLVKGARQALAPDGSNAEDVARLVYVGGEHEEDE